MYLIILQIWEKKPNANAVFKPKVKKKKKKF